MRPAHEAADLDRAAAILGYRPADWRETDAAMERFVQTAGPAHDAMLRDYFARQVADRMAAAVPARELLTPSALQPFRSEERRVGQECGRTCSSRWLSSH